MIGAKEWEQSLPLICSDSDNISRRASHTFENDDKMKNSYLSQILKIHGMGRRKDLRW